MFGLTPLGSYLINSLIQNVVPGLINGLVAAPRPQFIQISGDIMSSDVREMQDSYILRAILPGVAKESMNVKYVDNYLTLTANCDQYLRDERGNYIRYIRQIDKSFYFNDIDGEKIDGSFENGVLQLILPKIKKDIEKE
jgi:HSP20 family molecular chaperone IbpA